MEKIEKQRNPKVINLLRRKFDLKNVSVLMNLRQDFKMIKQVLIEEQWMFNKIEKLKDKKVHTKKKKII